MQLNMPAIPEHKGALIVSVPTAENLNSL